MNKSEFFTSLQQVPKSELHVHIEAVITLNSIEKLYKKRFNNEMPKEEQFSLFDYEDLSGFITSFLKVQDLFTEVNDFDLLFDDFSNYLDKNNIKYCEAFFAPSAFLKKGFKYDEMIQNFSKNIQKIKNEKNIVIKLLPDVSRTFGLENAEQNYKLIKDRKSVV